MTNFSPECRTSNNQLLLVHAVFWFNNAILIAPNHSQTRKIQEVELLLLPLTTAIFNFCYVYTAIRQLSSVFCKLLAARWMWSSDNHKRPAHLVIFQGRLPSEETETFVYQLYTGLWKLMLIRVDATFWSKSTIRLFRLFLNPETFTLKNCTREFGSCYLLSAPPSKRLPIKW